MMAAEGHSGPFRVLVSGSRDWTDVDHVALRLDDVLANHPEGLLVVHGACPDGLDAIADAWAVATPNVGVERHPADWDSCAWECPMSAHRFQKRAGDRLHPGILPDYCPKAGPRRNALMVGLGAELMLGWPLGRSPGTRGCMGLARRAGIRVRDQVPR